jgi:hypothetical protein
MRHRNKQFYDAYSCHAPHNLKNYVAHWWPMHHRINLVKHALLDAPLNVCLWIASFLVVCDRWNPRLQLL